MGGWAGIQLYHPNMDSTPYSSISFWLNGGSSGGQHLQIYGLLPAAKWDGVRKPPGLYHRRFKDCKPQVMYFGQTPRIGPVPDADLLKVLDEYFAGQRTPEGNAWAKPH